MVAGFEGRGTHPPENLLLPLPLPLLVYLGGASSLTELMSLSVPTRPESDFLPLEENVQEIVTGAEIIKLK